MHLLEKVRQWESLSFGLLDLFHNRSILLEKVSAFVVNLFILLDRRWVFVHLLLEALLFPLLKLGVLRSVWLKRLVLKLGLSPITRTRSSIPRHPTLPALTRFGHKLQLLINPVLQRRPHFSTFFRLNVLVHWVRSDYVVQPLDRVVSVTHGLLEDLVFHFSGRGFGGLALLSTGISRIRMLLNLRLHIMCLLHSLYRCTFHHWSDLNRWAVAWNRWDSAEGGVHVWLVIISKIFIVSWWLIHISVLRLLWRKCIRWPKIIFIEVSSLFLANDFFQRLLSLKMCVWCFLGWVFDGFDAVSDCPDLFCGILFFAALEGHWLVNLDHAMWAMYHTLIHHLWVVSSITPWTLRALPAVSKLFSSASCTHPSLSERLSFLDTFRIGLRLFLSPKFVNWLIMTRLVLNLYSLQVSRCLLQWWKLPTWAIIAWLYGRLSFLFGFWDHLGSFRVHLHHFILERLRRPLRLTSTMQIAHSLSHDLVHFSLHFSLPVEFFCELIFLDITILGWSSRLPLLNQWLL